MIGHFGRDANAFEKPKSNKMAPSGFAQLLRLASRSTPVLNDEHAWNVQLLGITTDDLFAGNALGETSLPSHYDPALQTVIVYNHLSVILLSNANEKPFIAV